MAPPDQLHMRGHVIRLETHVWLEASVPTEVGCPHPGAGAPWFHDPDLITGMAYVGYPLRVGDREPQWISTEVSVFNVLDNLGRRSGVDLADHDVEVPGEQRGEGGFRLDDRELHGQMFVFVQLRKYREDQRVRRGLEGRDTYRATRWAGQRRNLRAGQLQPRENGVGVRDQRPRRLGEPELPAGAFEQRDPDL